MRNLKFYFTWLLQLTAAIILFQTLFFKFTASEESVYIFSKVGMEPFGRIAIGVAEMVASILLLTPQFAWLGAAMGIGIMAGALFFHFSLLGIVVQNDGGYLFVLCVIVFLCCLLVLFLRKKEIPFYNNSFLTSVK